MNRDGGVLEVCRIRTCLPPCLEAPAASLEEKGAEIEEDEEELETPRLFLIWLLVLIPLALDLRFDPITWDLADEKEKSGTADFPVGPRAEVLVTAPS